MVDFNIQQFLSEMRAEQQMAHREITERVHDGFEALSSRATRIAEDLQDHERSDTIIAQAHIARLITVEDTVGAVKWLSKAALGAVIVGIVAFLFDLITRQP